MYQNKFLAGRSPITCLNGCVASSQPLASMIGIEILRRGGNAADAAVAMAAALNVTEPCSTGLGGDAFCLFYNAKKKRVQAMNASGRSPAKLTEKLLNERGFNEKTGYPFTHGLSVTVPGAAAGWVDSIEKYGSGRMTLRDILEPAISLATNGYPVAGPYTSYYWKQHSDLLLDQRNTHGRELLVKYTDDNNAINYRAPMHGEVFRNPYLGEVMQSIAHKGKDGFYGSWIAESIVEAVKNFDGVMEKEDLQNVQTTFEDPICIDYKGLTLWETAPNSQGIVALIALNILKNFNLEKLSPDSPEYLHILIESLKLAFADGTAYCADPSKAPVPVSALLNPEYGKKRAELIQQDSAIATIIEGDPLQYGSDTVYFTVVDAERNACSFINSNYEAFGTGIVPRGCGFSLQNRGANFSLKPGHPNIVAPEKRPYHTIIPGMVTDSATGELVMSFGVMGGFMQPQGHVQVLLNCCVFGMNPQQALDFPRVCISPHGGATCIEGEMPTSTVTALRERGHDIEILNGLNKLKFGKGQIIAVKQFWNKDVKNENSDVMWAGCDHRSDGIAAGY